MQPPMGTAIPAPAPGPGNSETFTEECQREGLLWDMKDIIHDYKKKYACTQLEFQF